MTENLSQFALGVILGMGMTFGYIGFNDNISINSMEKKPGLSQNVASDSIDLRKEFNKEGEVISKGITGDKEALERFTPFAKESMTSMLGDYYHEYRIMSAETVKAQPINNTLYSLTTDVVLEKDGQYDWRRFETMVEGDAIVSFRLGMIDYTNAVKGMEGEPKGAKDALIDAFKALNTNNRELFGVQLRGNNKAQAQIKFEVDENTLLASKQDLAFYKTSYVTRGLGIEKYNQAYVLLKNYEGKKWQVEEIVPLGESL